MVISKQNPDYFEKYLDQKFDGVHIELINLSKQNEQLDQNIKQMWNIINLHSEKINEIFFIKKYYKVFLAGLLLFVSASVYAAWETYTNYQELIKIELPK